MNLARTRHRHYRRLAVAGLMVSVALSGALRAQQAAGARESQRYVNVDRGLSIDQVVAMALDRSPTVLAARAHVDAARGERVQSSVRPNPSLMFDWRREVGGPDRLSMIGLSLPLDFQRQERIDVADQSVVMAEQEAAEVERALAAHVRSKTLDLLAAARQLDLRAEIAETLKQFRDLVGARAETGATPSLERDMADVEARRAEAEVLRQRAAAAGALAELKGLVRLAAGESLLLRHGLEDIERSGEMLNRSASGTSVDQLLNTRPDVRAAEAQLADASARINLARSQGKPEVSLSGSYMRMDTGFPLFGLDASGDLAPIRGVFQNISIGGTITLPSSDRRQGDVAAATARAQVARHELDARRLTASAEIEAALVRLQNLEQALAIYATGLHALANKNLDVVRQSYDLGRATLLDVLNEMRRYLDVETSYTDVLVETLQARSNLASAIGAIR
jgi:cobalt-zinc-cadmium efflux system outer membrane protein